MNTGLLVWVVMGLAWVMVAGTWVASLALASTVGRDYVFTARGVSRIGPPVGRRLASTAVVHEGEKARLQQFAPSHQLSLLAFLGHIEAQLDEPRMRDVLLPDLQRFATLFEDTITIFVFCNGPCERLKQLFAPHTNVNVVALEDDQLATTLGVRVTPYALLLDKQTRLLAKGLFNHFNHLCLWVVKGGKVRPGEDDVNRASSRCESYFRESQATLQIGDLRRQVQQGDDYDD